MTSDEEENALRTSPIKVPCELELEPHKATTYEIAMDSSSLSGSMVSVTSTAIPKSSSTRPQSPVTTGAEYSFFSQVFSLDPCGVKMREIYRHSAEDSTLRVKIAANVKPLLHSVTGHEADEIIDVLYVKEMWFTTEVLIYALCLMNRLTGRYREWSAPHITENHDDASGVDSLMRSSTSVRTLSSKPSHICSSTSSDATHPDSCDELKGNDTPPDSVERVNSANPNGLGDVFNRYNTRRRVVALLLLSGKFHGDTVYKTSSLTNALNKYRCEKGALQEHHIVTTLDCSTATTKSIPNKPFPRIAPAHLGECEKRLFQELGCTAMVLLSEYQRCEEIVLRGI